MCWAIASLFHMAHSSLFDQQLNFALLTLAAFSVIFRPSLTTFLFLALSQLLDALLRMPHTTNHWLFTAFVNLTILQAIFMKVVSERTFNVRGGNVFSRFAPVVRVELIILYFFAFFHKLNAGFFTPATSCATDLLKAQQIAGLSSLGPVVFFVNAYFTVALEALIPVLLCFRATRNAGILCGIGFHAALSYSTHNAFYDFSSMVFASYFLFIDPGFSVALWNTRDRIRTALRRFFGDFDRRKLFLTLAVSATALVLVYALSKLLNTHQSVHLYFFWTVYSMTFFGLFLWFLLRRRQYALRQPLFVLPHWSMVMIPLIVFLNGTSPYLGLKTENSYAMFSNLRTEGGTTNHFLVPASVQIFDFQKEVVHIVSSTDPGLRELAQKNKAMVLFEFRNYVSRKNPEVVHYLIDGNLKTYSASDPDGVSALGQNPVWLSKFMKFRSFSIAGSQPCSH